MSVGTSLLVDGFTTAQRRRPVGLAIDQRIDVLTLEQIDEAIDLLLPETALAPLCSTRLQITQVRPAADRAQRHPEHLSYLRNRQLSLINVSHGSINGCTEFSAESMRRKCTTSATTSATNLTAFRAACMARCAGFEQTLRSPLQAFVTPIADRQG